VQRTVWSLDSHAKESRGFLAEPCVLPLNLDCPHLPLPSRSPQDLPNALSDAQIAEGLGLHDIKNRDWAIFKTSAVKGEGLFEGLDWLANMLKTRRK
jgi:hypothetical protein